MADSYIDPSPANFQAFKDLPRDEPIHMLNLLEYREQAEYPKVTNTPARAGAGGAPMRNTARPAARSSAA
jgi:hypothetical protein